ncbi:MAG TPA: FTR1 family protein [Gemmatimonadales bacterium]|nr:FTR1 family protein [Gemmatimonadales bacterium]
MVQRLRSITSLAAQEYSIGVSDGRVVVQAEVDEAKLFLQEARRTASQLPKSEAASTTVAIDSLLAMVGRVAPAESVALNSHALMQRLATRLKVPLDETPPSNPSLVIGAKVYASRCAACHGAAGMGDGPAGRDLTPPPTNLTDANLLADATLLDFYRRVTIGVAGTAMPAFETQLSAEERWAVAAYAGTLRVRSHDHDSALAVAAIFKTVRRQLNEGVDYAAAGETAAAGVAFLDAYMTFEQAERAVRARNAGLATRIEGAFAEIRNRAATAESFEDIGEQVNALLGDLAIAERSLSGRLSPLNLFTQSFVLLVREGLEAILVIGAILAFLARTGAAERRREVHLGVLAAIGASLVTAFLLEYFFRASRVGQETLEGGVMLVAAGMLFYVSYWLLSRLEVAKWNGFVRNRVSEALGSGSTLALASVAFLAVYREGFETVLFYKALLVGGMEAVAPVVAGMVVGAVVLGIVYVLINRFGVRLPLKPFFALTSAFLYYMAFVFAGKGIVELQEGGIVSITPVSGGPSFPQLGIYPTLESLLVQGLLVAALVAGLVWTFIIEPRRLAVTHEMIPDAEPRVETRRRRRSSRSALLLVDKPQQDMLRSLERMDADLAELRAEVERLKEMVRDGSTRP